MDVHPAVYIHKFEVTKARLEVKLKAGSILLVLNWDFSIELAFPRPRLGDKSLVMSSLLSKWVTWSIPVPTTGMDHDDLYLGNYAQLFDEVGDIPFPSWEHYCG